MCVLCWLRGLQGLPLPRDLKTDSRAKTSNEGPQPVLGYNGNSVLKSAGDIFFFLWKILYQHSATFLMQRVAPMAVRCPRMVWKMYCERQVTELCSFFIFFHERVEK